MTGNLEIRETKTKPQAIETSSPAHAAEASPTPWVLRPCGHGSLKPPYNQGPCCLGPIPPASPNLPTHPPTSPPLALLKCGTGQIAVLMSVVWLWGARGLNLLN